MNICFIMGKIINDINFKFILNGKNDSIVNFKIQLLNNSVINIIAFNNQADYCYRNLKINDTISVQGMLNSKMEVIAEKIIKWRVDAKDGKRKK